MPLAWGLKSYTSGKSWVYVPSYVITNMWLDLPNAPHMHTIAKNIFHRQSIVLDPPISWLIITTPLPRVDWSAFSEAWQTSTSTRVSIDECHWSVCTSSSHLAENHHLTHSWCRPWIYLYFVTFWVQWVTFKIAKLCCNIPLCGYLLPSTLI